MNLDLATLFWVMSLASFVMAASVLFVSWRDRSHDGLSAWGWGLALHFLSYPVFAWRLSGWVVTSIVLANLLTSSTIALHTRAVAQFQRHEGPVLRTHVLWLPVVLTVLVALLAVDHHHFRTSVVSALAGFQALLLGWLVWSPRTPYRREQGRILLFCGTVLMVLVLATRTALFALNEDWTGPLTIPEEIQSATYLTTLVILLLNTMGFVLMQKERGVELQHQQALHDPLTGIHNRRALMEQMESVVSQAVRHRKPMSMLMIDIDFFKRINDQYGHQTGDEVLKAVASGIQHRLRREDFLARFGGEEFVVVLPDTDPAGARASAEHIRAAIADEPVQAGAEAIGVTVSVGWFSMVPQRIEKTTDRMISGCDAALYEAKRNGRNRVEGRVS
jgi:diguanylate cyclase (GGDEF)-like protein